MHRDAAHGEQKHDKSQLSFLMFTKTQWYWSFCPNGGCAWGLSTLRIYRANV